jgi:membrane protease YdiL (CAAX protease family)
MNPTEQQAIFSIAATVLMSLSYFIVLEKVRRYKKEGSRPRSVSLYILRKTSGFLLLGLIPAVIAWGAFGLDPVAAGIGPGRSDEMWPWILGASVFFLSLNLLNSKNKEIQHAYPEMRLREWGPGTLSIAAGGWLLYLSGYEYLFRGILLLGCYHAFGFWPAITINLALYSALHLPKGMKEAIAAIPFGAFICFLTIESQSILPAIYLHTIQAVSCEMFCIWRNPDMRLTSFKTVLS